MVGLDVMHHWRPGRALLDVGCHGTMRCIQMPFIIPVPKSLASGSHRGDSSTDSVTDSVTDLTVFPDNATVTVTVAVIMNHFHPGCKAGNPYLKHTPGLCIPTWTSMVS